MAKSTSKDSRADPKAPVKSAPDTDAEAAVSPRKKRSVLKIALLLALLLGGAGGGAWYFLREQPPANGKPGAPKTAKTVPAKPPVFVTLEPFTVNLQHDDASPQYLQVGLSLKVADAALTDAIKLHMPEIRNRVLLLLSSKKASDISTAEGKQLLSSELVREIGQPLAETAPAQSIDGVLFTSFVIQ